jgi:hypothetical protein
MLIEDSIVIKGKHIILWFIMNQCEVGPIETVGYVQSSIFSFNRASMGWVILFF